MMLPPSVHKAFDNLIKWVEKPEWEPAYVHVFGAHIDLITDYLEMDEDELLEVLEGSVRDMFFMCVMEDFLSSRYGVGAEANPVGDYLSRRGWRESVPGRRYLESLRDSRMSLYEVVGIDPGKGLRLRDILYGGKAFAVREEIGSRNANLWDHLAARVVIVNGEYYFTGGILPYSHEMLRHARWEIDWEVGNLRSDLRKDYRKTHGKSSKPPRISRREALELLPMAQILTYIWVSDCILQATTPPPPLKNTDGDTIMLGEVRFPLQGKKAAVAAVLDGIEGFGRMEQEGNPVNPETGKGMEETQETADGQEWLWGASGDPGSRSSLDRDGDPVMDRTDDSDEEVGITVLGRAVLHPDSLVLTANSKERCEQGRTLLASRLGELVGCPVILYRNPLEELGGLDELDGEAGEHPDRGTDTVLDEGGDPAEKVPPEEVRRFVHAQYDRHYRNVLDKPVPMLGGRTPRDAAKVRGKVRSQVVDWLKVLENFEHRRARLAGDEPYDMGWIWQELGIRRP